LQTFGYRPPVLLPSETVSIDYFAGRYVEFSIAIIVNASNPLNASIG
jgi:hypothetical protein